MISTLYFTILGISFFIGWTTAWALKLFVFDKRNKEVTNAR